MLPRASNRASKVLAPIRRKWALSFEKAISIGLRSGLYGGRNWNQQPCRLRALAARGLVGGQVVENDDGAGVKHWCELRFNIDVESRAIHRACDDPRRDQRGPGQSGDKRLCPPLPEGGRAVKPRANPRPPAQAGQVRLHSSFVDEALPVLLLAHPRLTARVLRKLCELTLGVRWADDRQLGSAVPGDK